MRNKLFPLSISGLIIVSVTFFSTGCAKDSLQTTYTYFEPVYRYKSEVWQQIKSTAAQPLIETGKLVKYDNYIFLNEVNKGVHIIDNSNPSYPKNISFISIPGNLDIALKNNYLYADIFTDLITIDISNKDNIVLKKVIPNVFPERAYATTSPYDTTRYIVDWITHTTTDKNKFESIKSSNNSNIQFLSTANSAASSVTGVSGSMARFTIVNNYLYTAGKTSLTAVNISAPGNPAIENTQSLGWNIETIYPLKDKLFIGSQTGMYIFNIGNPSTPSFLSNFAHACFNDPVIADDTYAYITLRARTDVSGCWGAPALQHNELDIVDISDLMHPVLKKVYDMSEPKGLCKDGDYLFICDGKAGLKVYNVSTVSNIQLVKQFTGINAFDVIAQSGNAIVVADNGIYQYDYTNINNIKLISRINIAK